MFESKLQKIFHIFVVGNIQIKKMRKLAKLEKTLGFILFFTNIF